MPSKGSPDSTAEEVPQESLLGDRSRDKTGSNCLKIARRGLPKRPAGGGSLRGHGRIFVSASRVSPSSHVRPHPEKAFVGVPCLAYRKAPGSSRALVKAASVGLRVLLLLVLLFPTGDLPLFHEHL